MNVVVDASVAVKWVVQEDGREQARHFLLDDIALVAPEFLLVEVANVLRSKVARGQVQATSALDALATVRSAIGQFVPDEELAAEALRLGLELEHPVYDCLYLACATRAGSEFVTADIKLLEKLRRVGGWSRARALIA